MRYVQRTVKKRRDLINEIKSGACSDCGQRFPWYVMQFDHRNSSDKKFAISRAIKSRSTEAVLEEITKCDLVCANCHAIRTHGEKHGRFFSSS